MDDFTIAEFKEELRKAAMAFFPHAMKSRAEQTNPKLYYAALLSITLQAEKTLTEVGFHEVEVQRVKGFVKKFNEENPIPEVQ